MKCLESNLPKNLKAHVHYIHNGNSHDRSKYRRFIDKNGHLQYSKYTTIAEIIDIKTGKVLSTGMAYCCKDTPLKQRGRQIAVGRAIKKAGVIHG